MKIHLNPDRINTIKRITKKYILVSTISTIILSSTIAETNAQTNNNRTTQNIGYYQLSDDKDYIYIENTDDLSIINKLEDLTEIALYNSNIDNSLENTTILSLRLESCYFNDNNINLPESITELEIDNTSIKFNNLNSLTNLQKITFKNIEFDSLSILKDLTNIKELSFDSCNIGSLEGIENMNQLKELSFVDTGIESIEQLKSLVKLNSLTLRQTYVTDLSPIKDLNISFLDITDSTNIKNLKIITKMKRLSSINATNCEMSFTKEIIDYIERKNIYSNISNEGLTLQNKINSIVEKILNNNMSDTQKIETIVQYVIKNLEYDDKVSENTTLLEEYNTNALKYALEGKGCCKNYTALTTALLRAANINIFEQKNDDHIWNIVELENNYYYIDSTFIDDEEIEHLSQSNNFMTNNSDFIFEHNSILIPSSMYNKIHKLNSTTNNEKYNNTSNNKKNLSKSICLGSIIGIAISLNSAFLIKKSKKIKNNNNEKRMK